MCCYCNLFKIFMGEYNVINSSDKPQIKYINQIWLLSIIKYCISGVCLGIGLEAMNA
jgi:hypothetical protein